MFGNETKKKKWLLTLMVLLGVLPVAAQQPQNNPKADTGKLWGLTQQKPRPQIMTKPAELPNLPNYSANGLRFMNGYTMSTEEGGTVAHMRFLSKEEPSQIGQWYTNTLSMYKWNLIHKDVHALTATDADGHFCSVNINPCGEKGFKSQFLVTYRVSAQH